MGLLALHALLRITWASGLGLGDDYNLRTDIASIVYTGHVMPSPKAYRVTWWLPTALSARLFGLADVGLVLPIVIASVFGAGVVYLLGSRLYGRAGGVIATLLLLVHPLDFAWSTMLTEDIVLSAMLALTVLLVLAALDGPTPAAKRRRWTGAALAACAAFYAKISAIFLAPGLLAIARRDRVLGIRISYEPPRGAIEIVAPDPARRRLTPQRLLVLYPLALSGEPDRGPWARQSQLAQDDPRTGPHRAAAPDRRHHHRMDRHRRRPGAVLRLPRLSPARGRARSRCLATRARVAGAPSRSALVARAPSSLGTPPLARSRRKSRSCVGRRDTMTSARPISADSHVTEHPDCYRAHIEARLRDDAPHVIRADHGGDVYVIPGMPNGSIPVGLVAAAGMRPEDIKMSGRFEDWHAGGWDPDARLPAQDRDGVEAEVIYPTIGMVLCSHPDLAYKRACMQAYNRWMAGYCAAHPDRLIGVGQTALRTPEEGIRDLEEIKALGLRGVMLPGVPGTEDYHHAMYDPFWEAAIDLELPLSFHILTSPGSLTQSRGPAMNFAVSIIRANQDIIGMLIFGGVFERHPRLRIVCVEADAGWAPHWMYRMDHYWERHHHLRQTTLSRLPSEYFLEHVYLTFQDDWSAFRTAEIQNPERLMWANDFPHSDSCWPRSQEVIRQHADALPAPVRSAILRDNVAALYRL